MMLLRTLVSASLLAALVACGGGAGSPGARGASGGESLVVVTPVPDKLPFDPKSVRLRRALDQLAQAAGHPVSFYLDAAVVPQSRAGLESDLVDACEKVATDLTRMRRDDPQTFARAAPALERIERKYDAAAHEISATFSFAERRVVVTGPARWERLVDYGTVAFALLDEYDAFVSRSVADVVPERVAPAERRAYFEALVRSRPGYGWLFPGYPPPAKRGSTEDATGELVLRVIALARAVGDSDRELATDVRAWLVDRLRDVQNARNVSERRGTPRGRTDEAYGKWLASVIPSLSASQKETLVRVVFEPSVCFAAQGCFEPRQVYPGVDPLGIGLSLVDDWIRAGHPATLDGPQTAALDYVVCPHFVDARGKRTRNRNCSDAFYRDSVSNDRDRFAQAILARNDAAWTAEVFTNVRLAHPENVIALWRALASQRELWRVAARTLVEHLYAERSFTGALEQEGYRLWKEEPAARGAALYLIGKRPAGYDPHYADGFWTDFVKRVGAPVSDAELAAMLELDPRSMTYVPLMWKGLAARGRMQTVVAGLRPWLAAVRPSDEGEPGKTLRALFARACADKSPGDLQMLQGSVRALAAPGADAALANLAAAKCGAQ